MSIDLIPPAVRRLNEIVDELELAFPERKFTLDGHLVGSLGEVFAKHAYGLDLLPAATSGHGAKAKNGRFVQVKATQRDKIGIRSKPDHLLVLKLLSTGFFREEFNGPGDLAWNAASKPGRNGQRSISLKKLKELRIANPKLEEQKLPQVQYPTPVVGCDGR